MLDRGLSDLLSTILCRRTDGPRADTSEIYNCHNDDLQSLVSLADTTPFVMTCNELVLFQVLATIGIGITSQGSEGIVCSSVAEAVAQHILKVCSGATQIQVLAAIRA